FTAFTCVSVCFFFQHPKCTECRSYPFHICACQCLQFQCVPVAEKKSRTGCIFPALNCTGTW
ncbi:unnamed protein product, partial [Staurois parvus]